MLFNICWALPILQTHVKVHKISCFTPKFPFKCHLRDTQLSSEHTPGQKLLKLHEITSCRQRFVPGSRLFALCPNPALINCMWNICKNTTKSNKIQSAVKPHNIEPRTYHPGTISESSKKTVQLASKNVLYPQWKLVMKDRLISPVIPKESLPTSTMQWQIGKLTRRRNETYQLNMVSSGGGP